MGRPKYKELYLEQKKRADYWAERAVNFSKEATEARALALQSSKDRATMRSDFYTLHRRASTFLDQIKHDLLAVSVEKDGWLYIPALAPEESQSLLVKFGAFSTYVNDKRPPGL